MLAPSTLAASYSSPSMPMIVARYTTMPYPTDFHMLNSVIRKGQ